MCTMRMKRGRRVRAIRTAPATIKRTISMGILDGIVNSLLNPTSSGNSPSLMTQALQGLIQQHGGLSGLVSQLSQGGLAEQAASWVGAGQNMPVSASQIVQALGSGKVAEIAQHLGVDPSHAGGLLAQVLPELINHLTPNGVLPAGAAAQQPTSDLLGAALKALAGKLG
jgi:uncharacterized protein YidB (DUF937 family)